MPRKSKNQCGQFSSLLKKIARKIPKGHNPFMKMSVQSIIGKNIFFRNKEFSKVSGVYFSIKSGKLSGITTLTGHFYSSKHLIFSERGIQVLQKKPENKTGKNWIGYQVLSLEKEDIGNVTDIQFNPNMFLLNNIIVTKSVFGLPFSQRIFPYERVIDIRGMTILIDDDSKIPRQEMCPAV
jgi:sporulation protein YlmC with PRC-barrel domain